MSAYKVATFVGPEAVRGNDDDIWLKARFLISKNKTKIGCIDVKSKRRETIRHLISKMPCVKYHAFEAFQGDHVQHVTLRILDTAFTAYLTLES